ncbi:MAG: hypothetical protein ACOVQ4_03085 [Flectobacillus sp.]|uniref:hypothetical protein n=1 Tax=Flectobacillus sp. TaxID=50419 RepID=UPI003B9968A0
MKSPFNCYLLLLIMLCACDSAKSPKHIIPAFYYWKTVFKLSENEKQILTENHIQKLYVKFFDVDLDNQTQKPTFKALLIPRQEVPSRCNIVPVVFITNQTLKLLKPRYLEDFAEKIKEKIDATFQVWVGLPIGNNEIQLDCDWTMSTKKKYFTLLTILRKKYPKISATIRLHQVKFSDKTGVPPVERGMLMCYNMADWKNEKTVNSIFTPDVLSQYIGELSEYPLPLDLVMPAFHWTVGYRNHQFQYFLNAVSSKDFSDISLFEQDKNRFVAQRDTTLWGIGIRKGDVFRTEEVAFDDLSKGCRLVKKKISNQKLTFALYHLDSESLKTYTHEQIKELYQPE